jgi:hypothetical protein
MGGSKIWLLFNLYTKDVERYGDADFDEYQFPFGEWKRNIAGAIPL